jgi:hypothetical protein
MDFRTPENVGVQLDTLFGSPTPKPIANDSLIKSPRSKRRTTRPGGWSSWSIRRLLLFTRRSTRRLAIRPCLHQRRGQPANKPGVDARWRVLKAGDVFAADVEYRLEPISQTKT